MGNYARIREINGKFSLKKDVFDLMLLFDFTTSV